MSPCLAKAKGASPVYFLPFLLAILGEVGESLRQTGRRRRRRREAAAVMKEGKEDIGSTDGECRESARGRGVRG